MDDPVVKDSQFTDNKANGNGGAIYSDGGQLSVQDSTFQQNQATAHGGTIVSGTEDSKNK